MLPRRTKVALSGLAGAALLLGLIAYVGAGEVLGALRRASPLHVLLALGSYATFFLVRGLRWRVLLRPLKPGIPLRATAGLTAVGWLINTFVPMKAGDVARAALLDRREGTGFLAAASTVALERVLDLAGIALFASVGLFLLPRGTAVPSWFARGVEIAWLLPLLAVAILLLGLRYRERFNALVAVVLRPLPERAREKATGAVRSLLAGSEGLAREPRLLLQLLPLTVLQTAAQVAVFVFLFLAFAPGTPVLPLFAGVPLFLLSFAVAITPGNVGTYEAAFAAVFIALGLRADVVVPVAVLTHLSTFLFVTLLGAAAVAALGIDASAMRKARSPVGAGP